MMKAIGYIRVSTARQASEGVSLDAQRAKLTAWADLNGYELVSVFEDAGISGARTKNRPGLRTALEAACKEKAALVVYSLSRLARSTRDALTISEKLDRAGADLVSLSEKIDTTSAAGKMVFRMLAVLSEFERDQISERTSAAMQYKRSKLEYTGGDTSNVRYGYSVAADGVSLIENESEQSTLAAARRLHGAGLSLRAVARELASMGFRSRAGTDYNASQIQRMVKAA